MSSVLRPSFELVKERRILKKIKQLSTQITGYFLIGVSLVPGLVLQEIYD
jgi:hypothetical protein